MSGLPAFHAILLTAILGADPGDGASAARAELQRAVQAAREALAAGEMDEALAQARKASEAESLPASDPQRLEAMLLLGHVHRERREPDAAIQAWRRVAELAQDLPSRRLEARLLIARVHWDANPPGAGEAAELLADADRSLGPEDPLLEAAQRFVFERFVVGVELAKARSSAKDVATAEVAETQLEEALRGFHEALAAQGAGAATASLAWLGLAHFQWEARRLAAAGKTLDRMAPHAEDLRFSCYFEVHYWNLRGLLETEVANFATARDDFLRALAAAEKASQTEQLLVVENNLGQLALRLGDYSGAERRLESCAETYAQPQWRNHPGRPFALANLAKARENSGKFDEARRLLEEALEITQQSSAGGAHAECVCRAALAINAYTTGDFEQAKKELDAALAVARRAYGDHHLHVAELEVDRSWIELSVGNLEEADRGFAAALDTLLREHGENHPRAAETTAYLARAHAALGQSDEARREILQALDLRRAYVERSLRTTLSQRDRLAFVQAQRVHPESRDWPGVLDTFLELAPQLEIAASEQYQDVLRWKGVVPRHAAPRGGPEDGDPRVQELHRAREWLLRELRAIHFEPVSLSRRKQAAATAAELESRLDRIEVDLQRAGAELDRPELEPDLTVEAVAAGLSGEVALVDVVEVLVRRPRDAGQPRQESRAYVAFVLRRGLPVVRVNLGDAAAMDDDVSRLRRALDEADPEYQGAAESLARRLREPLAAYVNDVQLLLVAGDGQLNHVPLGVLPIRPDGPAWIEATAFAWIPEAQWASPRTRAARPIAQGLLAVGEVEYGAENNATWPPLPRSGEEAREVARLFQLAEPQAPVALLTGRQAAKDAVLRELPQRRFVHLATHGFFRGRQEEQSFDAPRLAAQLDSGVVFATGKGPRHDQLFTAEEAASLDLRGVELITLSACETGLGRTSAGQGVTGLATSLQSAGAKKVIAALWKVDDEATLAFMGEFYRRLWEEHASPPMALQAAQVAMLRGEVKSSAGQTLVHPKYWAAFTAFGPP